MNDFYSDMQKIASSVLGDFAQGSITYVAITHGNGPRDDPGKSVETLYSVNGVARGVRFGYVDNSLVLASDLQVTIPADVITPQPTGFVEIDGTRYKIVKIVPKPAAGIAAAYDLIVRK